MSEFREKVISVLIVDDDMEQLEYFKIILGAQGFKVSIANTPREGLQMIRSTRFDAIVSDFNMPGADGGEFIKYLRTSKSAPRDMRSAIILCTNSLSINRALALELGANNFCEKKYIRDKLGPMIRDLTMR